MNTNQTSKWFVDAALFSGFILAFLYDLTGLELHQWTGVAVTALAGYHLITHWSWVSAVTRRFLGKTSARARLYYGLDASIFLGFFVISLTGLAISSWLDLALANAAAWLDVHIWASIATLAATAIKIGLHWRWIANVVKKAFADPAAPTRKPVPAAQLAGTRQMERREFLQVMGVVGIASAFAIANAANALQASESAQASSDALVQASADTTSQASASPACVVRCERGCSFPGHCRRYTDSDGNNRCDLGECT